MFYVNAERVFWNKWDLVWKKNVATPITWMRMNRIIIESVQSVDVSDERCISTTKADQP